MPLDFPLDIHLLYREVIVDLTGIGCAAVEVGTLRRHIGLPTSMAALVPGRARLDDNKLVIEMKEAG
jgi:hypothetical protein